MSHIKIRPGYLINLNTRVTGGIRYDRHTLEQSKVGHTETERWESTKIVEDAEEYALASAVRNKVRSIVKAVCAWTPFGLICPIEDESKLDAALAEARKMVDEFNHTAYRTKVSFSHLRGEIAENQSDAIAAVRGEIASLLDQLGSATAAGKIETIRDVANRATQMGRLLNQQNESSTALGRAIVAARKVATQLSKQAEENGVQIADVLAEVNTSPIAAARFLFSDVDEELYGEMLPSVSLGRFNTVSSDDEFDAAPETNVKEEIA